MSSTRVKLWINGETGTLYSGWNTNSNANALLFTQGDAVDVEIHLVRFIAGTTSVMEELDIPAGSTIRLAIGKIDTAGTAGTYDFTYGTSTVAIGFADTAAVISTKINALIDIIADGGVAITKPSTTLVNVNFNTVGVKLPITIDASKMTPPTSSRVVELSPGTVSTKAAYVVKVKQSPVVYQDVWADLEAPTLTLTTLQANKGKRVTIAPEPKAGSWSMTGTADIYTKVQNNDAGSEVNVPTYWTETTSKRLSVNAVGTDFAEFQYSCSKVDAYTWDFYLKENYAIPAGYTMPLTATGDGLVAFGGKHAVISFNTAEVEYLLNGAASATAFLEIELQEVGGKKWTILQTTCVIKNDLIDQTSFSPLSYETQGVTDAPVDGIPYVRKNAAWVALTEIDGGTY